MYIDLLFAYTGMRNFFINNFAVCYRIQNANLKMQNDNSKLKIMKANQCNFPVSIANKIFRF